MSDSRAYYPGPTVTKKKLVDDVDIPKTGYVQNSKPLQYPPDLENRQLQADNARLREDRQRYRRALETIIHCWAQGEENSADQTLDGVLAIAEDALTGPEKPIRANFPPFDHRNLGKRGGRYRYPRRQLFFGPRIMHDQYTTNHGKRGEE